MTRTSRQVTFRTGRQRLSASILAFSFLLLASTAGASAAGGTSESEGQCGPEAIETEVQALTNLEGSRVLTHEELVAAFDDADGVLTASFYNGRIEVVAAAGELDVASRAVDSIVGSSLADVEADLIEVKESCVSRTDLATALKNVGSIKLEDTDSIGTGYSQYTDRIVVTTTLTDVEGLARTLGVNDDLLIINVHKAHPNGVRFTRTSDVSPHNGGAVITGASGGSCSSGFSGKKSNGVLYGMTAGHCGGGSWTSGSNTFATGTWIPNYPARDVARLSGSSHDNLIYGANNNFSSRIVNSAGNPANGYVYSNFGAVTRDNDFTQTHTGQSLCDADGCTTDLALSSTPNSEGTFGDSGGPIGKKSGTGYVKARGSVVGGTGPFPGNMHNFYYHRKSEIETTLGISILTS